MTKTGCVSLTDWTLVLTRRLRAVCLAKPKSVPRAFTLEGELNPVIRLHKDNGPGAFECILMCEIMVSGHVAL